MTGPLFVKLTRSRGRGPVWVNMNRALYITPGQEVGSRISLNIPDTVLDVLEDPKDIIRWVKEQET